MLAFPADWGPNEKTGRIADLSPGLMDALNIDTDDEVEVIFPYEEGAMRQEYFWALMTLIIAIALALVLLSIATDDPRSQPVPELQPSAYDQKLHRLDRRGTEAAYTNRLALLYHELDDRYHSGQPGSCFAWSPESA